MKKILVTGAAGFIGFHTAKLLSECGYSVVGIDNMNTYYDVQLKEGRLKELKNLDNFRFKKLDIADAEGMEQLFIKGKFDSVIHLAAQAGVRYSITNPKTYIDSNIIGFFNVLENCRACKTKHLIFASSSSVYGANRKIPYSARQNTDHPMSLYAATKKADELMAHAYSSLYSLPVTGLRFFTVYGPWGRPDMAYFIFTKAIHEGSPIKVFNKGNMMRDFTYIDDITKGIRLLLEKGPAKPDEAWDGKNPRPDSSYAPYRILNIGNNNPVKLEEMISVIEGLLDKKAVKEYLPMQAGDVCETWADIDEIETLTGFKPNTDIRQGLEEFVKWYLNFYYL